MNSHIVPVAHLLTPEERAAIDAFGAGARAGTAVRDAAAFLRTTFAIDAACDPDVIATYERDESNLPGHADAVCRPVTARECAAVIRTCSAAGIPCTVSGGRSNLTGSATPEGGIVLSTAALCEPALRVMPESRTVRVHAGMLLEDMRRACIEESDGALEFPVNPTSRQEASIGGCIACNSSGFTPGEQGAMRAWVRSLQLVLPGGGVVEADRGQYRSRDGAFVLVDGGNRIEVPVPRYLRPAIKNASGPWSAPDGSMDLVDFIIGSEGIYGVVPACTLLLAERAGDYLELFISLPGEADALRLLDAARRALHGDMGAVAAFEYFGTDCRALMDHETELFRGADQVAVYIQEPLRGADAVDRAEFWVRVLHDAGCGAGEDGILVLDSDRTRTLFLEARHSLPVHAIEIVKRRGGFTIITDALVPPDRFASFLGTAHRILRARNLEYALFGHLGDCHLHFTILPQREEIDAGLAAYDEIMIAAARLGGVYSGEHGTGKRKRGDFLRCYGEEAVRQVRAAKSAVDPRFILNRGDVIET
ncbi:FAD-binding oxidoreductase [bacterium]|nr:FAD-binding oxidoreductase [bacterium]